MEMMAMEIVELYNLISDSVTYAGIVLGDALRSNLL